MSTVWLLYQVECDEAGSDESGTLAVPVVFEDRGPVDGYLAARGYTSLVWGWVTEPVHEGGFRTGHEAYPVWVDGVQRYFFWRLVKVEVKQ